MPRAASAAFTRVTRPVNASWYTGMLSERRRSDAASTSNRAMPPTTTPSNVTNTAVCLDQPRLMSATGTG